MRRLFIQLNNTVYCSFCLSTTICFLLTINAFPLSFHFTDYCAHSWAFFQVWSLFSLQLASGFVWPLYFRGLKLIICPISDSDWIFPTLIWFTIMMFRSCLSIWISIPHVGNCFVLLKAKIRELRDQQLLADNNSFQLLWTPFSLWYNEKLWQNYVSQPTRAMRGPNSLKLYPQVVQTK